MDESPESRISKIAKNLLEEKLCSSCHYNSYDDHPERACLVYKDVGAVEKTCEYWKELESPLSFSLELDIVQDENGNFKWGGEWTRVDDGIPDSKKTP